MLEYDWIGILAAAILQMIVGSIWYSPKLFGGEWKKLAKIEPDETVDFGKIFGLAFVCAILMAWVLSAIVNFAGVDNAWGGAFIGFLMWLGFVATTQFSGVLWENRSLKLFGINASCSFITLVLMGAIVTVL